MPISPHVQIIGVTGMPEIGIGDDLATLIMDAMAVQGLQIQNGDVLVVAQKAVSKAEGRVIDLADVTPSAFADAYARQYEKDARQIEVVLRESKRIVRMDRGVLITETHHGFVCANAAVDASNTPGREMLTLLPIDPDASAARLRESMERICGVAPAVLVSDTFGRPWREGIVNVAIGVAGMVPLRSYVGQHDPQGYELRVSVIAVADEIASASELVMGKIARVPVALVRGFPYEAGAGSARDLLREAGKDLFR